jgi:lipoate-protein ligase A
MAMDEAVLQSMSRLGTPVLRFYSWTTPASSFGYFQKYGDVERLTHLRPLLRRPTGGGVVPHDADWTYSVAFPNDHSWYALSAIESYRRIHEWIKASLAQMGIESELAPTCRRAGLGQCFVGHEQFDVLWKGLKIAGAAQRRTRDGLLIQGSVQPGSMPVARVRWEHAMRGVAGKFIAAQGKDFFGDEQLSQKAAELNEQKYSREEYLRRR